MDKKGASNLAEQKSLIRPIIKLLKQYHIIIIGDREFHSVELAKWLKNEKKRGKKLDFALRQKAGTFYHQGVGRITEKKRRIKRNSDFWLGLYGEIWINNYENYEEEIEKIMKINKDKSKYYQQGIKVKEKLEELYFT